MRNTVNLISAFSVVGMIVGIIIVIFSESGSSLSDIGMVTVIAGAIVTAICQIIVLILRRKDPGE